MHLSWSSTFTHRCSRSSAHRRRTGITDQATGRAARSLAARCLGAHKVAYARHGPPPGPGRRPRSAAAGPAAPEAGPPARQPAATGSGPIAGPHRGQAPRADVLGHGQRAEHGRPSPRRAAARIAAVDPSSRQERGPPHGRSASSSTSRVPEPGSRTMSSAAASSAPPTADSRRAHGCSGSTTTTSRSLRTTMTVIPRGRDSSPSTNPTSTLPSRTRASDLRGVRHLHRQHHVRGLPVQGADPARQQVLGHRQRRRDAQVRALLRHQGIDARHQRLCLAQHPAAEGGDPRPGRRERGSRRAALQQADAQPPLELAHPHADGRLRQAVPCRRLPEAAQLRDGVEQVQRDQVRHRRRQHPASVT